MLKRKHLNVSACTGGKGKKIDNTLIVHLITLIKANVSSKNIRLPEYSLCLSFPVLILCPSAVVTQEQRVKQELSRGGKTHTHTRKRQHLRGSFGTFSHLYRICLPSQPLGPRLAHICNVAGRRTHARRHPLGDSRRKCNRKN